MPKAIDLTGQRFGRLIVINKTNQSSSSGSPIYYCRCDCGKYVNVLYCNLRAGKTKSCGCLRRDLTSERMLKDLTGKKIGRLTVIKIMEGRYNRQIKYLCKCECGNETVVAGHNLITGRTKSCGCFNIDKLTSDVVCDTKVSALTSKMPNTNSSGVKGVYWDKLKGKWKAFITFQKKRYHLGYFDDLHEATNARKVAEEKLFGEFLDWYNNEFKKLPKEKQEEMIR